MKQHMITAAIAATALFVLTSSDAAYSEEQAKPCACTVEHDQSSRAVGAIEAVKGTVYATSANGFGVAEASQSLIVGSEMIVGAESSAKIAVGGTCALDVAANTDVKIEQREQKDICVRLTSTLTAPSNDEVVISPAQANGGEFTPEQQILLGVGAAAGIGTLIWCATDFCKSKKKVSP